MRTAILQLVFTTSHRCFATHMTTDQRAEEVIYCLKEACSKPCEMSDERIWPTARTTLLHLSGAIIVARTTVLSYYLAR